MRINNLSKWFQTNPLQTKILELIMDAGIFVMFLHDIITALISEGEEEEDILQALADLTAKGILVHCHYGENLTTVFFSKDAMLHVIQINEDPSYNEKFRVSKKMTINGTVEQHLDEFGRMFSTCSIHSSEIFEGFGPLETDIEVTVNGSDVEAIAKAQEEFFKTLSDDVSEDNFDFDFSEIDNINCE